MNKSAVSLYYQTFIPASHIIIDPFKFFWNSIHGVSLV